MPQDSAWFYFNGFNSAIPEDYSGNAKIVAVAACAERMACRFHPVSVSYRNAREHSLEILARARGVTGRVVFSGSSMGGWFARVLQLRLHSSNPRLRSAAVAFNPAYDLVSYWQLLLGPQENHVTGERYEWTSEHGRGLAELEAGVDYGLAIPYYVYVDKGDELIPWEGSAGYHRPIAEFTPYEGGCHSFEHYCEALRHFEADFGE